MSFLDLLNQQKQNQTGLGQTFTQQAEQMKTALTGKEVAPAPIQKSNLAEQTATAGALAATGQQLKQAQGVQQQADTQAAQIQQQRRMTSDEYQQKQSDLVAQTQRQFNIVYNKLSENYKNLDEQQQEQGISQLEFLHNLADKKYTDQIQVEGDKRRLDDQTQMQTAMLYATFDDSIDMIKQDEEFKRAFNADNRTFNEYIATILPSSAIQAALTQYRGEQSEKAAEGMARGISGSGKELGEGIYNYNKDNEENKP